MNLEDEPVDLGEQLHRHSMRRSVTVVDPCCRQDRGHALAALVTRCVSAMHFLLLIDVKRDLVKFRCTEA